MTNQTKIIAMFDADGSSVTVAVNDFIKAGILAGYINFNVQPAVASMVGDPPGPYVQWLVAQVNYYDPAIM